jgi:hypothetical protein
MSKQVHGLKTWPASFQRMWDRVKTHEVRKVDRDYQVGDELYLKEYDPWDAGGRYSGRTIRVLVTYISMPGTWDLPANVCVMSVRELEREE